MNTIIIGLIAVSGVFGFLFYKTYHTLTKMMDIIDYNRDQINLLLEKRFRTFEALITSIHQFMDYDRSTLKDIMTLRARSEAALSTGDEKKHISSEQEISRIAKNIPVIFEQYPELKSGRNVLNLQEEIANSETKLAYATQAYNENLARFLVKRNGFIATILTLCFPDKLNKSYLVWV
jgi:LemA protein